MSFRSFLYEDFDHDLAGAPAPAAACAAPVCEGRLSREIEIVRREGFEAGRTQGFGEGRLAALEEAEVRLARDLPELLAGLGGTAAELGRLKRTCEREAYLLASAALRQMLPIIAERGLAREAAALVARVIANAPTPAIEVQAAPGTLRAVERWCGLLPPGIVLVADPDLAEGSLRCTWGHGQARFDGAAVTDALLEILAGSDLGPEPPAATEPPSEDSSPPKEA